MQENPVQGHQKSMPTLLQRRKRLFREKQTVLPHPSSLFPHPLFTRYEHSIEMANIHLFWFYQIRNSQLKWRSKLYF